MIENWNRSKSSDMKHYVHQPGSKRLSEEQAAQFAEILKRQQPPLPVLDFCAYPAGKAL